MDTRNLGQVRQDRPLHPKVTQPCLPVPPDGRTRPGILLERPYSDATLASSTLSPGPMVELSETFLI